MKAAKLPLSIQLERKYNDINMYRFINDWTETKKNRKNRVISMSNDLYTELDKFKIFEIDLNEMIDIGLRYALNKKEFRNMLTQLIKEKDIQIVHAHSRASSWSCQVACKLAGIPLITTTHGRQPIHFSR